MRRLVSVLGMPQHRFASIHVVGTNGKSSVAAATAALLEAHGIGAGAYLSPHGERWSQRVVIGGEEIRGEAFGSAVERVAAAVAVVNRGLAEDDSVTQFEAATTTAFVALADARVRVGVIEAGLGGRLDATNVLLSRVTVLTSIGLDHTQWLGESEIEIAAEKLAVLRDHTLLVAGELDPEVAALAEREAGARHARMVVARDPGRAGEPIAVPYQRRNFALALAAASELAGALDPERVAAVAAGPALPGRMEVRAGDPPLVLDAAHNPAGALALAEALEPALAGRHAVACIAVLADKDAAAILAALAPAIDTAICTEVPVARLAGAGRPETRSHAATELAALARGAGIASVEAVADPVAATERARELARRRRGVMIACGSHYLLGYASEGARS